MAWENPGLWRGALTNILLVKYTVPGDPIDEATGKPFPRFILTYGGFACSPVIHTSEAAAHAELLAIEADAGVKTATRNDETYTNAVRKTATGIRPLPYGATWFDWNLHTKPVHPVVRRFLTHDPTTLGRSLVAAIAAVDAHPEQLAAIPVATEDAGLPVEGASSETPEAMPEPVAIPRPPKV